MKGVTSKPRIESPKERDGRVKQWSVSDVESAEEREVSRSQGAQDVVVDNARARNLTASLHLWTQKEKVKEKIVSYSSYLSEIGNTAQLRPHQNGTKQ